MKNKVFERLVGFKLTNILFQPTKGLISPDNMFVLNFENSNTLLSLHVFCFLRIMMNNRLLLVSSDEYVDTNYNLIDLEVPTKESMVYKNATNVQRKTSHAVVTQATLMKSGDVLIKLSNDIIIEIFIDCNVDGYEYYRLSDYYSGSNLLVVYNKMGQIHFD